MRSRHRPSDVHAGERPGGAAASGSGTQPAHGPGDTSVENPVTRSRVSALLGLGLAVVAAAALVLPREESPSPDLPILDETGASASSRTAAADDPADEAALQEEAAARTTSRHAFLALALYAAEDDAARTLTSIGSPLEAPGPGAAAAATGDALRAVRVPLLGLRTDDDLHPRLAGYVAAQEEFMARLRELSQDAGAMSTVDGIHGAVRANGEISPQADRLLADVETSAAPPVARWAQAVRGEASGRIAATEADNLRQSAATSWTRHAARLEPARVEALRRFLCTLGEDALGGLRLDPVTGGALLRLESRVFQPGRGTVAPGATRTS
ncbi:MAG: hypothetical protein H0V93_07605 [Euzebyales bacterium]|nr:hypothetical protein [Euzebyales bacterium]